MTTIIAAALTPAWLACTLGWVCWSAAHLIARPWLLVTA